MRLLGTAMSSMEELNETYSIIIVILIVVKTLVNGASQCVTYVSGHSKKPDNPGKTGVRLVAVHKEQLSLPFPYP